MVQTKQKTIGIDTRFYGEAGPGRYAKNIVEHLEKVDKENKYIVFLRKKGFDLYEPKNPNFKKVLAHYKWYSFEEQIGFLFKILSYKLDLLYVPHFNIPILYPGKLITAIPDIIMHTFSTEKGTTLPSPYFKFKKFIYFLVVLWAVVRSKKVIVPSLDVKNDFVKTYPFIKESKYLLAHEGVDPDFTHSPKNPEKILEKYNIKTPFLLYISSFYEHKNTDYLIEMYKILISKYGFKGQMVLVGKSDKFAQRFYEKVKKEGLAKKILMPGLKSYVIDTDVVALRILAEVYVFPSLKEGFSLTPLEGQIWGLPAVISDIPCHKEIYGNSVLYFDPHNPTDMAKKVNKLLTEKKLREQIINRGYGNTKKYSWLETAKITLAQFNTL